MRNKILYLVFFVLTISVKQSVAQTNLVQEWLQSFNGTDSLDDVSTSIDVNGNVYVAGGTQDKVGAITTTRLVILKYNLAGVLQWSIVNNTAGTSFAFDLKLDENCDVYITGGVNQTVAGATSGFDILTAKYNTNGVLQWERTYDGTLNAIDIGNAIAVDANQNVYVTGISNNDKLTTIKYNSSGTFQWVKNNITGAGTDIAVSDNGNSYVTGRTTNRVITIKYNTSGTEVWNQIGSIASSRGKVIIIDNNENVFVLGVETTTSLTDILTIKYNSAGTEQWRQVYDGPINSQDEGYDIAIDNNGNVYITGGTAVGDSNIPSGILFILDYITIKYNSDGTIAWLQQYNGPDNDVDFATALVLDADNNVFVTGASRSNGTDYDYATLKYSAMGDILSVVRYNGSSNGSDVPSSIGTDSIGNVYVTGQSFEAATNFDIVTIKYLNSDTILPIIIMDETRLVLAINEALNNTAVSIYKQKLEKTGFEFEPEASIGFLRQSDDASIVTLPFKKGRNNGQNPVRTSFIAFSQIEDSITVEFFDAIAIPNPNLAGVNLNILKEVQIDTDGNEFESVAKNWERFFQCVGLGGPATVIGCLYTNGFYLECVVGFYGIRALLCIPALDQT